MKRQIGPTDVSNETSENDLQLSDVGVAMSASPKERGQKRRRVSFHKDDEIFHAASQVTEEEEELLDDPIKDYGPVDHPSWISKDELRISVTLSPLRQAT